MPAPHHSIFYRPDALPDAQPTATKHWRKLCHLSNAVESTLYRMWTETVLDRPRVHPHRWPWPVQDTVDMVDRPSPCWPQCHVAVPTVQPLQTCHSQAPVPISISVSKLCNNSFATSATVHDLQRWIGLVVARWSRSMKLLYTRSG